MRMVVKVAASICVSFSAARQRSEFPAKAVHREDGKND
jgi:hypothetical protein